MPPKKKKTVSWQKSQGRKLLFEDVRKHRIPTTMSDDEAFALRPEFHSEKEYADSKRLFPKRLESARNIVAAKQQRADAELALLQQDRAIHPFPALNHRGEPQWEGSPAQLFMKQDIADKKHVNIKPAVFQQTRPEYAGIPLKIFRGHIYQEARLQKFNKQYRGRFGYDADDTDHS